MKESHLPQAAPRTRKPQPQSVNLAQIFHGALNQHDLRKGKRIFERAAQRGAVSGDRNADTGTEIGGLHNDRITEFFHDPVHDRLRLIVLL